MKEKTNSIKHIMESCFLHQDKEINNHMLHIFRKVNPIIHVKYLSSLIHGFSFLLQQTIHIHILTRGKHLLFFQRTGKLNLRMNSKDENT